MKPFGLKKFLAALALLQLARSIIQYNSVKIWITGHEERLILDTASCSHPIILEMLWYKRHNLKIDYSENTMTFDSDYCQENCSQYSTTVLMHSKDRPEFEIPGNWQLKPKRTRTQNPRTRNPETKRNRTPRFRNQRTRNQDPQTRNWEIWDLETERAFKGSIDRWECLRVYMQLTRNWGVLHDDGESQCNPSG